MEDCEMIIKSSEFLRLEANKLVKRLELCKSEEEKAEICAKLKYLCNKISFEIKNIDKILEQ